MKKLTFYLLTFILAGNIQAEDTLTVNSIIKEVVVYRQGVLITRNANQLIKKGKTVIVFDDLSNKLDKKTMRIKPDNDITIVSVTHRFNYLNKTKSTGKIAKLQDEISNLKDSMQLQQKILEVLANEKQMLLSNMAIGGQQNGVNIKDLVEASDFFRERLSDIELKKIKAVNKARDFRKEMGIILLQLNEWNIKKNKTTSEIVVVVTAKKDIKTKFDLKYYISDAGWDPYYDVRVKDTDSKVLFNYKANVFQNTDYDWKNVKLTLSTSNPELSGETPKLSPYKLNQYTSSYYYNTDNSKVVQGIMSGRVTDNRGEPLPGVAIVEKGTNFGTMTDANGNFKLKNVDNNAKIVASYIGMKTSEFPYRSGSVNVILDENDVDIDDVVITAMGVSRDKKALGYSSQTISGDELTGYLHGATSGIQIRGASSIRENKKKGIYDFGNSAYNMPKPEVITFYDFAIPYPYSIPSDNKNYDVSIKDIQLAADYEYSSVPKLSEKSYLTANIVKWQDNNLLTGDANIYFKDTYTGATRLNLENFSDTLRISLGVDNDIQVKRESISEFSSDKFLGSNRKVDRAWKITIRNNKNFPVTLNLEDQIPVSEDNKIKVEKIEDSSAIYEETSGKLKWKLELKAGEQKEIIIKYSVKSPSSMRLIIE